ncbi:MAG: hypothetical protein KFKLKKLM_00693 [Flavobacteriales bacterium]|nr:hypothetical protein [Flavobacteriales bacterium]
MFNIKELLNNMFVRISLVFNLLSIIVCVATPLDFLFILGQFFFSSWFVVLIIMSSNNQELKVYTSGLLLQLFFLIICYFI